MDRTPQDRAVALLAEARRSGRPLAALGAGLEPASIAEAHAVQDALVDVLDEAVAGWKVAGTKPGEVMRGAILASRLLPGPARIDASSMPLLGVEAEIAFRFDRPLPAREAVYGIDEVRDAVTAFPAIEVVDSRVSNYRDTPVLHRLCDCMSNGALVCGAPRPDWRDVHLGTLAVTLTDGDDVLVSRVGGHANGDPILPAVALANEFRGGRGIEAGQVVTTGSYTGLVFARPGALIAADFAGFGRVEVLFAP